MKRTIAYFDGQNLFNQAKEAFGYTFPNYDPQALASAVCRREGFSLSQIRFYTGLPEEGDSRLRFWTSKLAQLGRRGISTFTRPVRNGREKGIDIRIALDVVGDLLDHQADVVLIFSQDQDFSELAKEVRKIAKRQQRWIRIASAFPVSDTVRNRRGINSTDWIRIDRNCYDACIDPRDYRS